jgi:flagellar hook-basal body complex protein FliE
MIIPPIGGVGAESALLKPTGAAQVGGGGAGLESALQAGGANEGSQAAGGLGEGAQAVAGTQAGGVTALGGGEPVSFGGALEKAISSLEQTQQSAAGASQSLAMGTASDPESAVITVEDAQLAMQLASQIRTKATEAAQSIFQTQV